MLAELDARVQAEYEQSRSAAASDPQQAGHLAEATWARVLDDWLPHGYSVATRRYITPETNDDEFEIDLVVFRPSVPPALRKQTRVPHGAVAAAFSVRRTADRAGLRDAVERATRLRRGVDRSPDSALDPIKPEYPVGFLALSHGWSGPREDVVGRVTALLLELDEELAEHPAESLDLCCIGDLGAWSRTRFVLPAAALRLSLHDDTVTEPAPMTILLDPTAGGRADPPANPVGLFIRELYSALEQADPGLRELAYSLRKQVRWPEGLAQSRLWR